MGSCFCCQSNGHCDSAEETSLLQNDAKAAAVAPAETPVVGTCGPGIEEDISKEDLNKGAETEPYSAQENGTLKKNSLQTEAPSSKSPNHQENKDNAQDVDVKASSADTEIAGHQQSTLTPQHMGSAHAGWEVSKTTPEEEKHADDKSLNETAVCTKAPSLIETQPKQEHIIMDSINNNSEDAGGSGQVILDKSKEDPSTETTAEQKVELLNAQPAAPVCLVLPITELKEEVATAEAPSSVDKDDPENRSSPVCVEAKLEGTQSHEVPESSLGSESTPDHSSVPEPDTTTTADVCKSSEQVEKSDSECTKDSTTEESQKDVQPEEQVKEKDDVHGEKKEDTLKKAAESASERVPEVEEAIVVKEVQLVESFSAKAEDDSCAGETAVATKEGDIEDDLENSEEDLYRGAEELSASLTTTSGAASLSETFLIVEDRCSLAPAVDILSYSEREWRGNTTKSALIRKGYKEMMQSFSSLRRVRGDNYCALRATLYQILSNTTQMPEWLQEESITMLPKDLEAQEGLISQWIFPGECLLQGDRDTTQQLTGYMELLRNKWQAAVDCVSPAERQQMCEQLFQGGEEELGMLEALKLLMLSRAVELHGCMQKGEDMPLFCWLLFARDSSDCPRSFLNNHLSHVGLSAGLEQVEMFLLGYALQCTIQVYRLYKADTEEFVTFYPDDHKDDWPCVCLVTEDDRHYNVPVLEAADLPQELKSS